MLMLRNWRAHHRHVLGTPDCRHSSGTAVKNQPPGFGAAPAVVSPPKQRKPTIKKTSDTSYRRIILFAVVGL